jgi:hypothetical protein
MKTRQICILLIIALLLNLLYGCNSDDAGLDIITAKHNRDDLIPRIFDAWSAETKNASYLIEKNSMTESDAKILIESMEEDLSDIQEYSKFDQSNKPNIIVTEIGADTKSLESVYFKDTTVVMSKELIAKDEHLPALITFYSECEPWIANGIAGVIASRHIDNSALETILTSDKGLEVVQLSGLRFYKSINSTEDVELAKDISTEFIRYLNQTYGKNEIAALANKTSAVDIGKAKREWLKTLGVTESYTYVYEGFWDNFIFRSAPGFAAVIEHELLTYNMTWNPETADDLKSVYAIERFLYESTKQIEQVKILLKESTSNPDLLNLDSPVQAYIYDGNYSESPKGGDANQKTNIIRVYNNPSAVFLHELLHIYLGDDGVGWITNGIIMYIVEVMFADQTYHTDELYGYTDCNSRYALLRSVIDGTLQWPEDTDPVDLKIPEWFTQFYLSHGGKLDKNENFDSGLFLDGMAYAFYMRDKETGITSALELKEFETTYTTTQYAYSASFTNYLISKYSLKDVFNVLFNYSSLEATFGKTYTQLHNDWRSYIESD